VVRDNVGHAWGEDRSMIRSVGRLGPLRVVGLVMWQLRFTFLAIAVMIGVLVPVPDAAQNEYAAAVLSVLGIGASVFIAFRNTTAYNRWWEARTLWGGIIINSRTLHNGLTSVDDGSPEVAGIADRMRRRQVRYDWQLAAELRRVPVLDGVRELTPEDPPDADAVDLLNRQAADIQRLSAGGHIDPQARVLLMTANTGAATAQSGLERIRNEPVPIHYDLFIQALAWFFGIMAFSRLDGSGHHPASVAIGAALMTTFIVAERLGHFIEQPMNNSVFDIPMYRICGGITANLLGAGHPLARPRESEKTIVWM
jgi:putative membrane protein